MGAISLSDVTIYGPAGTPTGIPNLMCISIAASVVTNGDYIDLPVDRVLSVVGNDQTTAGVLSLAVGTGANSNRITITCTTDDAMDIWALVRR
jgi:hypothetical protein